MSNIFELNMLKNQDLYIKADKQIKHSKYFRHVTNLNLVSFDKIGALDPIDAIDVIDTIDNIMERDEIIDNLFSVYTKTISSNYGLMPIKLTDEIISNFKPIIKQIYIFFLKYSSDYAKKKITQASLNYWSNNLFTFDNRFWYNEVMYLNTFFNDKYISNKNYSPTLNWIVKFYNINNLESYNDIIELVTKFGYNLSQQSLNIIHTKPLPLENFDTNVSTSNIDITTNTTETLKKIIKNINRDWIQWGKQVYIYYITNYYWNTYIFSGNNFFYYELMNDKHNKQIDDIINIRDPSLDNQITDINIRKQIIWLRTFLQANGIHTFEDKQDLIDKLIYNCK